MRLSIIAPAQFPAVRPGDDLVNATLACLSSGREALVSGDILVFAQKVISKAEGCYRNIHSITPSTTAIRLAERCGKHPGLVELILTESSDVLRCEPGVIIVRHRLGWVMANAGIDQSNIDGSAHGNVLLLPEAPDHSAADLRKRLMAVTGVNLGVLIIDSVGRAWRQGTTGMCIGAAGVRTYLDLRGEVDLNGRRLQSSTLGHADEIAASASMAMGQGAEGRPLVLVRGLPRSLGDGNAQQLIRPVQEDLFL